MDPVSDAVNIAREEAILRYNQAAALHEQAQGMYASVARMHENVAAMVERVRSAGGDFFGGADHGPAGTSHPPTPR